MRTQHLKYNELSFFVGDCYSRVLVFEFKFSSVHSLQDEGQTCQDQMQRVGAGPQEHDSCKGNGCRRCQIRDGFGVW